MQAGSVHKTEDCGENRKYSYRRLEGQVLRFRVKAEHDANICLSSAPRDTSGMYEVLLCGWKGKESAIRKNKTQDLVRVATAGYLNKLQFRGFWILIVNNTLKVGREKEATPFLEFTDHTPLMFTHYGYCTAWGASGEWTFNDEEPANFSSGLDMKSLGTVLNQLPPSAPQPAPTPNIYPSIGIQGYPQAAPPISTFGQTVPPPSYAQHQQSAPAYPTPQPVIYPTPTYPTAQPTPGYPSYPPQTVPSVPASNHSLPLTWVYCTSGLQCASPVPTGPGNGSPLVILAHHEGGILPGVMLQGEKTAQVSFGRVAHAKNEYYMLSNSGGVSLEWVGCSDGEIPKGTVQAGKDADGELLYIGRVKMGSVYISGKIHRSHKKCYIATQGKEKGYSNYDVLCVKFVPMAMLGMP